MADADWQPNEAALAAGEVPLWRRVTRIPPPVPGAEGHAAAERVAELVAASPELARLAAESALIEPLLAGVLGNSPFLRDLATADPDRLAHVLGAPPHRHIGEIAHDLRSAEDADQAEAMRRLRRAKQEAALLVALADLGGVWEVAEVTAALTRIADAAVCGALRFLLRDAAARGRIRLADAADPERDSGYIVLAMGKHGAAELNYSSDIDLIVLYDRARAPLADGVEPSTFFVRLTQALVKMLQERTAEGYVFRVDLRLRPDPGATAIALSVAAALQYYESMGQNWERAALIKARPCAGDIPAGTAFLREIAPFIWRKYFDFAAIQDVHSIKRQIHAHKGHGRIAVEGHNVKLGRGGIREVEFFVQTQQLIAGGRNPALRGRGTLAMLDELVRCGWVEPAVRDDLAAAYLFLRRTEHAVQMVADEQTHSLPATEAELARVARLVGFADLAAFRTTLVGHLERVQSHYAALFENEAELSVSLGNMVFTGDEDDPGTIETLRRLGFANPGEVTRAVRAWHFGRYPATRSGRAREQLTELVPHLLAAFAETDNADQAFAAFDRFVARLPAGVQLFAMLAASSDLLQLLATIMGAAPRLAETIARRPHVVDAVLDPAFFDDMPTQEDLADGLAVTLAEATGHEDALSRARIFGQEQLFLIGVRLVSGSLGAEAAGAAYTALAEVVIAALLERCLAEIEKAHGRIPGGAVVVLGMGKLGGREMTAASDLDLILLYGHDDGAATSDGPRPLSPSQYYARLTQRLVSALSAPTAEGVLYAVDFRLRPSGNAGPIATRADGFVRYQAEEAWTWEHMALTRARPVAGNAALAVRVEEAIGGLLTAPRDAAKLRTDIAEMRGRIEREKGTRDPWDLKQVPGGLVDLEFIAQGMQLLNAAGHPGILDQNTSDALRRAREAGVLAADEADGLLAAARLQTALSQVLRVAVDGRFDPAAAPRGLARLVAAAAGMPDLATLEAHLVETQAAVRSAFVRLVGPPSG